jgi:PBSX family phage terminase large subunit
MYGGSRSGKTSLGVYLCLHTALRFPGSQILICKHFLSDLRKSIVHQTIPQIGALLSPDFPRYFEENFNNKDYYIQFSNKSVIWFEGLSNDKQSEKILGREYNLIFLSECTQVEFSVYSKLLSRLAKNIKHYVNRVLLDCNPTSKKSWVYCLFVEHKDPTTNTPVTNPQNYSHIVMNPTDNPHIPHQYLNILKHTSSNELKRFYCGEWADDLEGALWKHKWINDHRRENINLQQFDACVLGVDPAVSTSANSDETGLIVAGRIKNEYYIIADLSGVYTPLEWAKKIAYAYEKYSCDYVIVEVNQGGDLVKANIKNVCPSVFVKSVHAKRGKILRAEPIAALYESGLVHHVNYHKELEYQLIAWDPGKTTFSPDRVDALVYALTELSKPKHTPAVY